jgi:hypothetical protein
MDRTHLQNQNTAPSSFTTLPTENKNEILRQINPVDKPTLYSVAQVSRTLHALVMPFLMECYLSTSERSYPTLVPQKKIDAVLHLQNWLVETAEDMPSIDIVKAWNRFDAIVRTGLNMGQLQTLLIGLSAICTAPADSSLPEKTALAIKMRTDFFSDASARLQAAYVILAQQLNAQAPGINPQ